MDSFYLCLIDKHHICVVTNEVIDANPVSEVFFVSTLVLCFERFLFRNADRKKIWLVIMKVCFELVNGVEIHNYI